MQGEGWWQAAIMVEGQGGWDQPWAGMLGAWQNRLMGRTNDLCTNYLCTNDLCKNELRKN
jgi:hypothetical protein